VSFRVENLHLGLVSARHHLRHELRQFSSSLFALSIYLSIFFLPLQLLSSFLTGLALGKPPTGVGAATDGINGHRRAPLGGDRMDFMSLVDKAVVMCLPVSCCSTVSAGHGGLHCTILYDYHLHCTNLGLNGIRQKWEEGLGVGLGGTKVSRRSMTI